MTERDLLEQVRLDDTYDRLTKIIEEIGNLSVFPSLVWVWTWDVVLSTIRDFGEDEEFKVNKNEKETFELFWDSADKNGWTLEYGTENLYDFIREWIIEENIVSYVGEDEDE